MAATYPTDSDTQAWASANGANPDYVDTYAAANDRLPASILDLNNWINTLDGNANWPPSSPQTAVDAYTQANLGPPVSVSQATTWFQQQGFMDSSGNWTGFTTPSGYFYDQGTGQTSTTTAVAASPTTPGTSSTTSTTSNTTIVNGMSLNDALNSVTTSIQTHPIMWAGLGVVVLGGIYLWRHR